MYPDAIYTETCLSHTIYILPDDSPESPRSWSNLCTMYCWHRRYLLGDIQPSYPASEFFQWLMGEHLAKTKGRFINTALVSEANLSAYISKHFFYSPLYLYDHSGLTISTSKFSCPWDSGQVGYIVCEYERAQAHFNASPVWKIAYDHDLESFTNQIIKDEVKTYDQFLRGEVYGYSIVGPVCNDSCFGFYGPYDGWSPRAIGDQPETDDIFCALSEARKAIYIAISNSQPEPK